MLISVVIPVYNNERYVKNAVSSVILQSYKDIEIVIIDDGSTDKTGNVVDELAAADSRIRVIHQENRWIYGSMNRGIQEASGKYVYILNSDDILYPDSLSQLFDIISQKNVDVVWTRIDEYRYCEDHVEYLRSDKEYKDDIFLDNQYKVRKIWPQLYFDHIACNQANLYRRELMLKHPFREDVYGADVLFNLEIANDVNSAYILKNSMYRFYEYSSNKGNASIGKFYRYEHDMFNEFYLGYLNLFREWKLPDKDFEEQLADIRIKQVTREVRSYGYFGCDMSDRDKLYSILSNIADETVMECASCFGREWEVESRILSGISEVFHNVEVEDNEIRKIIWGLVNLRFSGEYEIVHGNWDYYIYNRINTRRIGRLFLDYKIKNMNERDV